MGKKEDCISDTSLIDEPLCGLAIRGKKVGSLVSCHGGGFCGASRVDATVTGVGAEKHCWPPM